MHMKTTESSLDTNADDDLPDDGFRCVDHMKPKLQEIINQGFRGEALIAPFRRGVCSKKMPKAD